MTSTACLLITLPPGADICKVFAFLKTSNFNDFAVTSQPLSNLINLAFGAANNDNMVISTSNQPTCVIARVSGELQQLYKDLIENGFQFIIASRPFHELVSVVFSTSGALQPKREAYDAFTEDYLIRPPSPIDTPPESPVNQDENDSPRTKRRRVSRGPASSDRARCQICRKYVLGTYIKPEDIIRHAFYHGNITRYACMTCKQGSSSRTSIQCICGTEQKIVDYTNPAEAPREIIELAKQCFPNAYELCF